MHVVSGVTRVAHRHSKQKTLGYNVPQQTPMLNITPSGIHLPTTPPSLAMWIAPCCAPIHFERHTRDPRPESGDVGRMCIPTR